MRFDVDQVFLNVIGMISQCSSVDLFTDGLDEGYIVSINVVTNGP